MTAPLVWMHPLLECSKRTVGATFKPTAQASVSSTPSMTTAALTVLATQSLTVPPPLEKPPPLLKELGLQTCCGPIFIIFSIESVGALVPNQLSATLLKMSKA